VIHNRRSIRDFTDEKVNDELIEKLIDSARYAPSACNMQVYKLILVNSQKLLKDLSLKVTGKINWTKQLFVLFVDPKITYENHANYISAGMAVQNLMLKAHELGLGTCPISGFKNKEYLKKRLGMSKRWDVPLLIFFGYPNNKKIKNYVPYRCNIAEIYRNADYDPKELFPTTSDLNRWTQEQIYEYRKRIFPVYFPRFHHSLWKGCLDELFKKMNLEVELNVSKNKSKKSLLYYFMWEKDFLDRFEKYHKNRYNLHVSDIVPKYLYFLKKEYSKLIVDTHEIQENEKFHKKFDIILLTNTLLFQKDCDMIFKSVKESIKNDGEFKLSIFNKTGIFGISYWILQFTGLKRDVYHNSSFYKIGPFRFLSDKFIKKMCKKYDLEVVKKEYIQTKCLQSRVPKRFLRKTMEQLNKLFPETILYTIVKK